MDKIYKAIWSKVKNCCVAVSEFAKHNGKDRTSVNCCRNERRGAAEAAATGSAFARKRGIWPGSVAEQSVSMYTAYAHVLRGVQRTVKNCGLRKHGGNQFHNFSYMSTFVCTAVPRGLMWIFCVPVTNRRHDGTGN
jgi:hypothetical protein